MTLRITIAVEFELGLIDEMERAPMVWAEDRSSIRVEW